MNFLSLLPQSWKPYLSIVQTAVPILKCSLEGHEPGPEFLRVASGFVLGCKRCKLTYWRP